MVIFVSEQRPHDQYVIALRHLSARAYLQWYRTVLSAFLNVIPSYSSALCSGVSRQQYDIPESSGTFSKADEDISVYRGGHFRKGLRNSCVSHPDFRICVLIFV